MPRLYGELEAEDRMKVRTISYPENSIGGVYVAEVLKGEGIHYVNPITGEQWYENGETSKKTNLSEIKAKLNELTVLFEKVEKDELDS